MIEVIIIMSVLVICPCGVEADSCIIMHDLLMYMIMIHNYARKDMHLAI